MGIPVGLVKQFLSASFRARRTTRLQKERSFREKNHAKHRGINSMYIPCDTRASVGERESA